MKVKSKPFVNLSLCLALLLLVSTGCSGLKNPFRDYSRKPFSSADWRQGDAVERGRMMHDLMDKRAVDAKHEAEVREILGEPDRKTSEDGRVIWLYHVDLGHNSALPYLPISFDSRTGAFVGRVKGGTMSLLVEG